MWKIQRKHIGSNITKSPADQLYDWCANNLTSLAFILILSILWLAVLYGICSIVSTFFIYENFRIENYNSGSAVRFHQYTDEGLPVYESVVTVWTLFSHPITNLIKFIGFVLIVVYVFKSTNKTK